MGGSGSDAIKCQPRIRILSSTEVVALFQCDFYDSISDVLLMIKETARRVNRIPLYKNPVPLEEYMNTFSRLRKHNMHFQLRSMPPGGPLKPLPPGKGPSNRIPYYGAGIDYVAAKAHYNAVAAGADLEPLQLPPFKRRRF